MTSNFPPLSKLELILVVMLFSMTIVAFILFKSLPPAAETVVNVKGDKFYTKVVTESDGSATSGKLFSGSKVVEFQNERFFRNLKDLESEYKKYGNEIKTPGSLNCENWGVVTTIFEPSDAVKKQVLIPDWCLVVVGDRKGPLSYSITAPLNNFIFLTAAQQDEMAKTFPVVKALPWNHFGRKNVGFLYAILHGAKTIWDFDDDNILIDKTFQFALSNSNNSDSTTPSYYTALEPEHYDSLVLNPYPIMGANVFPVWPRGFPLERIISNSSSSSNRIPVATVKVESSSVGILQSLANHDPDVDAIYRLTQPLPFDFPRRANSQALLVPIGCYSPYNAQATLHMYSSLWSLLLPVTVHGRVSDIWRGYFAQRLGEDIGMRLAFTPPMVAQFRNSHNYLADFDSEEPLYKRSMKIVEQLSVWKGDHIETFPGRIEDLWIEMYEHGYIGLKDVELLQAWLQSLFAAGYKFPLFSGKANAKSILVSRSPQHPFIKPPPPVTVHPKHAGNHSNAGNKVHHTIEGVDSNVTHGGKRHRRSLINY